MFSSWLDRRTVAPVVAELAGTFLFFFVGIGAIYSLPLIVSDDGASAFIVVALAHGAVLAVLVSALGVVSGGHFNPAVTFGIWLAGKMPWRQAAAYGLAQLIGGLLAAWLLQLLLGANPEATPTLSTSVAPVTGIVIEAVITVVLVVAVLGTAVDPRAPKVGGMAIGLALGAGILMAGPLTGGAANPARWFGPAAVSGGWDNGYVWIVGPLLGAAIAALGYRYLFRPDSE